MVGISVGLSERMAAHTLLGRLLVKFIAKQADSLVYFSPDEKGALRKIGFQANQLHFLPFSVNASLFPFEAESGREEYDFVSVGRDPNRDFSSVAKLARSKPELRGLIITSASMAPPATELPHNLALKTDLPLEETLRQMRASRCVLLPTRKNTYSAATTTAILAMAIGRPAAISRIGEIAEAYGFVSGENCLILEPGEDLLPATARLLADSGFRTRLAVNARSLVENKLDQRSFAEQLASLIDAASAKKR
jgi:glycosyltransferase involved in cell wall biosynthesis